MHNKTPLFIVTGASGSGKTFVIEELRKQLLHFNVFDPDNIAHFVAYDWEKSRNIWLNVAKQAACSGHMTIICGTMMPWDVEQCEDYSFFKHVYYINLHFDAKTRQQRLLERQWNEETIQEHLDFANWLIENADKAYNPPMPTVDTTQTEVIEVAKQIKDWIEKYI